MSPATKFAVEVVKETSGACPTLKAVVGGLSVVLKYCDVYPISSTLHNPCHLQSLQQTVGCRKTIELLIPQVEELEKSLSAPVPEGEVKEEMRRGSLKG
jgi:hypothetical protein